MRRGPADRARPRRRRRRCTGRSRRRSATRIRAGPAAGSARRCRRPAALAADLGVSRGVVVEAYQQLVAEGYLTSRAGGYTQVAAGPRRRRRRPTPRGTGRAGPAARSTSATAAPTSRTFPRAAWLRSLRAGARPRRPTTGSATSTATACPSCATALADYLNRVRGTVGRRRERGRSRNGFAQGLALVVQVLAARGARRLAVEDPSADDDARAVADAAGLEVVGVPVGRRRRPASRRSSGPTPTPSCSPRRTSGRPAACCSAEARAAVLALGAATAARW